jgi:hypothetical protein
VQVLWQLTALGALPADYQAEASVDPTFTTGVVALPAATLQNNNTVFSTTDAAPGGRRCGAECSSPAGLGCAALLRPHCVLHAQAPADTALLPYPRAGRHAIGSHGAASRFCGGGCACLGP